jgi:uncharacterized membrane protein YfcA
MWSLVAGASLVGMAFADWWVRRRKGKKLRLWLTALLLVVGVGLIWLWFYYLRHPLVEPVVSRLGSGFTG